MLKRTRFTLALVWVAVGVFALYDGYLLDDMGGIVMGLVLTGLGSWWVLGEIVQ